LARRRAGHARGCGRAAGHRTHGSGKAARGAGCVKSWSTVRSRSVMPKRTLIQGAEVVTMDKALGDFASADILIEDGAIAAVGPALERTSAELIDGSGMIALPGIIDAHTCLWQTVLRGYVPDL